MEYTGEVGVDRLGRVIREGDTVWAPKGNSVPWNILRSVVVSFGDPQGEHSEGYRSVVVSVEATGETMAVYSTALLELIV